MEEAFKREDVKSRLLLSGINELSEYGARDFSLRRAAEAAGVSCAAPYRYFKGKEEYVFEIVSYLASRWEFMANEILKSYIPTAHSVFAELFAANIRFWLSHKNAVSVFAIAGQEKSPVTSELFDKTLTGKLYASLLADGFSEPYAKKKIIALRAMFIGYVTLIVSGELLASEESFNDVKLEIDEFIFGE